jgi:hypothetical protein
MLILALIACVQEGEIIEYKLLLLLIYLINQ